MSALTAALYAVLVVYLGGWFLGHWVGNFALLLFLGLLWNFLGRPAAARLTQFDIPAA